MADRLVNGDACAILTGSTCAYVDQIIKVRYSPSDQRIGAVIAQGQIGASIFPVDPLTAMPHDVANKALTRLATVQDVPLALNRATAELPMRSVTRAGRKRRKLT